MVRGLRGVQIIAVGVVAAGIVVGLGTVWLASLGPSFSRAASSPFAATLLASAGSALIVGGALHLVRGRERTSALTLVAAGFGWFIAEWTNPASAPAIVFTAGLLLGHGWPALVAHALVAKESPRSGPLRQWRGLTTAAYIVNLGILGLVPTLYFDPIAARCLLCPRNLLGIAGNQELVVDAFRAGYALQAAWILAAIAAVGQRLVRSSMVERRGIAIAVGPAMVALGAVGLQGLHSIPRGLVSNDTVDIGLWSLAAISLTAIVGAEAAGWLRRRSTRQRVARLALDLASAPAAGELAPALGREIGDETLDILFPLGDGRLVDAHGVPRAPPTDASLAMTDVRRGGAPVALLIHRAHVGADAERITAAVDAARLALENERLHAAAQARLRELRDSRAQIVAAADAERRRLERDLHDGSQQRLLAFAIDLATVRRRVSNASSPADESALAEVEGEVRSALEDLRELAHGIIPRSLADEGLAAALEELAERSAIPMDLAALPDGRCNQTVEGAGYIVVARATADPVVRRASVAVTRRAGRLVIDLELVVTGPLGVVTILELEDRCGAVDGMIALRALASDEVHLQAEMPCAS